MITSREKKLSCNRSVIHILGAGICNDIALSKDEVKRILSDMEIEDVDVASIMNSNIHIKREAFICRLSYYNFLNNSGYASAEELSNMLKHQPFFLQQDFGIIFEDMDFIVFNKPFDTRLNFNKDIPSYTGERCCISWLKLYRPEIEVFRFCHQLDYATSGILVMAKNQKAAADCSRLFRDRLAEKEYNAIVYGWPEWNEKTASWPIDKTDSFCMQIGTNCNGKPALTDIEVISKGYLNIEDHPKKGEKVSIFLLKPHTGRRHQLRVHCKTLGFPIVGDATYAADTRAYRMFLHASKLILPFPEKILSIECPANFDHVFLTT